MTSEMWLGLTRHLLTALGGVLVARGVVDTGTVQTAIGAIITLAGAGWSIWDKRASK
jgi:hypothetical protein